MSAAIINRELARLRARPTNITAAEFAHLVKASLKGSS
jgi:hypothetical protein